MKLSEKVNNLKDKVNRGSAVAWEKTKNALTIVGQYFS